jgi:MOSC domain-containing protein YiiM
VRQLLLLDKERLDAMDLRSGRVRENITTEGIDREWPGIGRTTWRIGPVLLQVSAVWPPCDQLRKGTAGLAPRNIWQARDVVPSLARWNNSRRDAIARVAAASS